MLRVVALLAAAAAAPDPFDKDCPQQFPDAVQSDKIDVYLHESPLGVEYVGSILPKMISAFHTAVFFQGNKNNESWTLEMDPADVLKATFPVLNTTTMRMDTSGSELRYCLYKGAGGYDGGHVTTSRHMAVLNAAEFRSVLGFAWPRAQPGVYMYETFHFRNASDPSGNLPGCNATGSCDIAIHDLTCAQGAFAVMDYINVTLGHALEQDLATIPMTTAELLITDMEEVEVDMNNVTDPDVVYFYKGISTIEAMKFGIFNVLPDFLTSYTHTYWYVHKRTDRDHFYKVRSSWPHIHVHHVTRPLDWRAPYGPRGAQDSIPTEAMEVIV